MKNVERISSLTRLVSKNDILKLYLASLELSAGYIFSLQAYHIELISFLPV